MLMNLGAATNKEAWVERSRKQMESTWRPWKISTKKMTKSEI